VRRNEAKILNDTRVGGRGVVQVDDSWQFGQVLAVVMIIANVNEMAHFIFGLFARHHRSHTAAHEAQAQEEGAAHQAVGPSAPAEYRPRGPPGPFTSSKTSCTAPLIGC
jgi:hypothetical protein